MNENQIEAQITSYLRFALPQDAVSFHIANGGYKLSVGELGRLRRAGYVAGVPDRCILWQGRAYFLEAKGPRGRLSHAQEDFIERIRSAGSEVAIVRSVDDVESALTSWGFPLNATLKFECF